MDKRRIYHENVQFETLKRKGKERSYVNMNRKNKNLPVSCKIKIQNIFFFSEEIYVKNKDLFWFVVNVY